MNTGIRQDTTMTLTELRYIVTLAQEQHFGRAADRCYVSQPTLSIAVKKLEDELGIALFERTKSRVQCGWRKEKTNCVIHSERGHG